MMLILKLLMHIHKLPCRIGVFLPTAKKSAEFSSPDPMEGRIISLWNLCQTQRFQKSIISLFSYAFLWLLSVLDTFQGFFSWHYGAPVFLLFVHLWSYKIPELEKCYPSHRPAPEVFTKVGLGLKGAKWLALHQRSSWAGEGSHGRPSSLAETGDCRSSLLPWQIDVYIISTYCLLSTKLNLEESRRKDEGYLDKQSRVSHSIVGMGTWRRRVASHRGGHLGGSGSCRPSQATDASISGGSVCPCSLLIDFPSAHEISPNPCSGAWIQYVNPTALEALSMRCLGRAVMWLFPCP